MFYDILIWIMRFVLLGLIYLFLYKVIKVIYSDLKGSKPRKGFNAGIEVVEVTSLCPISKGSVYPLHQMTSIGRSQDNTIVLNCEYVSGSHARIYLKHNSYILKDLDSTNGTYLNGNKVDRPITVRNNDLISIGGVVFKVIG